MILDFYWFCVLLSYFMQFSGKILLMPSYDKCKVRIFFLYLQDF